MRRQEEGGFGRVSDVRVDDRAGRDVSHLADAIETVLGEKPGNRQ